jgi:hypothetical protein
LYNEKEKTNHIEIVKVLLRRRRSGKGKIGGKTCSEKCGVISL